MTLSCVFASIRTSPRKRKDPPARNFKIPSNKAARKSNVPSVDLMDDIPDNPANEHPVDFAESADRSKPFSCSVRDTEMQRELETGSETELRQQVFKQKSQLEFAF